MALHPSLYLSLGSLAPTVQGCIFLRFLAAASVLTETPLADQYNLIHSPTPLSFGLHSFTLMNASQVSIFVLGSLCLLLLSMCFPSLFELSQELSDSFTAHFSHVWFPGIRIGFTSELSSTLFKVNWEVLSQFQCKSSLFQGFSVKLMPLAEQKLEQLG